ncbi:hypothetical protein T07_8120 [Trichinella nelsoni]|uniref:Uncharacterized protein n=1 Tax=Trichinella nelsoni TaxID=6336 RepID=A0A0V0RJE8_9BILA|nr:hypothetical protein T07_8120 [Trichinella nelsoni]
MGADLYIRREIGTRPLNTFLTFRTCLRTFPMFILFIGCMPFLHEQGAYYRHDLIQDIVHSHQPSQESETE